MIIKTLIDEISINRPGLVDIGFIDEYQDIEFNLVASECFNAVHHGGMGWFAARILAIAVMNFRRTIQAAAHQKFIARQIFGQRVTD